jgi:hypothetical protein
MRAPILTLLAALILSGCFVQTRGRSHASSARRRDCPPAHHWDGGGCVHNGKAKGHHKR